MKVCKSCQVPLPENSFSVEKRTKNGRRSVCRGCAASKQKRYDYKQRTAQCVCGGVKNFRSQYCRRCPMRPLAWRTDKYGYVVANRNGKQIAQHRWLMERAIGRPLCSDENVHHKNGKRDDNRLSNLEIWVKAQPAGQRVEDVVEWAKEILCRYGEHLEKIKM